MTGSLATILWLDTIRRESQDVTTSQLLQLGLVVMPRGFLLALPAILVL